MRLHVALSAYTCTHTVYTCLVGQEYICEHRSGFRTLFHDSSLRFITALRCKAAERLVNFISRAIRDSYDMHRSEEVFFFSQNSSCNLSKSNLRIFTRSLNLYY